MPTEIEEIGIGSDGMPTDERLRSLAVRLKYRFSQMALGSCREWSLKHELDRLAGTKDKKDKKETKQLWAALVKAKTVIHSKAGWKFQVKRLDPKDSNARRANFEAVASKVSQRICTSPEAVAKAALAFTHIKGMHRVLEAKIGDCKGVVVPSRINLDASGPFIADSLVIKVTPRGVFVFKAGREAFPEGYAGFEAPITVDPAACVPEDSLQLALEDLHISPYTSRKGDFFYTVFRKGRQAMKPIGRRRAEFSAFVGEEISGRKWQSFIASLRQQRPFSITWPLFANLDPEVRRAAMRNPICTYSLYNWLCGTDEVTKLRRLQASQAFPVLTQRLNLARHEIDNGLPLLPALSRELGIPVPSLRQMSGTTWQKLGSAHLVLTEIDPHRPLAKLLSEIPSERVPKTRIEWQEADKAASHIAVQLGWPSPGGLAKAVSKDWEGYVNLFREGYLHAIADTAKSIGPAVTGIWYEETTSAAKQVPLARLLAEMIGGSNSGLKRLRSFNTHWHRGVNRRTSGLRAIRRKVLGEHGWWWNPLTPDGFACPHGTLTWLTDEDMLAEEGVEMNHCVATYSPYCLRGRTHIAAVRGSDGSRSTVQFDLDGEGRLNEMQNQSYGNTKPGKGALSVVEAFLNSVKDKSLKVDATETVLARLEQVKNLRRPIPANRFVPVDEETGKEILTLFSDCLPPELMSMSRDKWASRLAAMDAFVVDDEEQLQLRIADD